MKRLQTAPKASPRRRHRRRRAAADRVGPDLHRHHACATLFAWTLGGADELSGYALAIASAWGFSSALLSRSHIRIDTVYVRVAAELRAAARPREPRRASRFFVALVTWYAWGVCWQSFGPNSHSLSEIETPLVIPQGLWFAGLVFFVAGRRCCCWRAPSPPSSPATRQRCSR